MTESINPYQACLYCGAVQANWIWRVIEPATRSYEIVCAPCVRRQDAAFTAEAAIAEAIAIIRACPIIIRPRIKVGKRGGV